MEDRRRERTCSRKRKYDRAGASQVLRDMRKRGDYTAEAYPCRFCHKWHIGHERVLDNNDDERRKGELCNSSD